MSYLHAGLVGKHTLTTFSDLSLQTSFSFSKLSEIVGHKTKLTGIYDTHLGGGGGGGKVNHDLDLPKQCRTSNVY